MVCKDWGMDVDVMLQEGRISNHFQPGYNGTGNCFQSVGVELPVTLPKQKRENVCV
jgi:hypothetical protein